MERTSNRPALSTTARDRAVVWTLLVLAVVGNIAGYALDLYSAMWWFDEVIHAYTIAVLTLFLGLLMYNRVLTGANTYALLLLLMIANIGLALGGLWEVAEWAYDQQVASNVILGKTDTIIDLIMDTIGSLAGAAVAVWMVRT